MDFHMKLPRNTKEFILFLIIVSVLSVSIISPIITGLTIGFSLKMLKNYLKIAPFIWISVVVMVLLTHPIAEKMTAKIVDEKDSFNSQITINILCNVFLMSLFMTIFGSWLGTKSIDFTIFKHYFYVWPRNFTIAFAVELLIAQPIARKVLHTIHIKKDKQVIQES